MRTNEHQMALITSECVPADQQCTDRGPLLIAVLVSLSPRAE